MNFFVNSILFEDKVERKRKRIEPIRRRVTYNSAKLQQTTTERIESDRQVPFETPWERLRAFSKTIFSLSSPKCVSSRERNGLDRRASRCNAGTKAWHASTCLVKLAFTAELFHPSLDSILSSPPIDHLIDVLLVNSLSLSLSLSSFMEPFSKIVEPSNELTDSRRRFPRPIKTLAGA